MATAATNFVFQTNPNALKRWRRTQCCYPNRFLLLRPATPQPPPPAVLTSSSLNQIKLLGSRQIMANPPKSKSKSTAAEYEFENRPTAAAVLKQLKVSIFKTIPRAVLLFFFFFFMYNRPKQALAASSSSVSVLGRVRATCSPFDSPPDSESQLRYNEAQDYSVSRTYFYSYAWVLIPFAIYYVIWNVLSYLDPYELQWFKRQIKYVYLIMFVHYLWSNRQNPSTVLKLQVNLSNAGRALQTDLNRIAQTANTSTYEGVKSILTGTASTFLRHPDCFISATSHVSVIKKNGRDGALNCLDQLSLEERTKISLKPLSSVKYLQAASSTSQISTYENQDEYLETNNHQLDASVESSTGQNSAIEIQDGCIKVIILVAVVGEHDFPTINSWDDLKQVLQMLTSVDPEEPVYAYGVEVLWSPQSSSSWGWRRWFK